MTPLVSILIPAYNAERWIADTMQSALAQTWPNKEIIILDDGSRDQTLSIARRFASKEVSIVAQENQGVSAARNKAFSVCQGDYVQWLDADDLLSPNKIAKQMAAAEACESRWRLFSSAWGYFIFRPNKARFSPTPLWCDLSPIEWLLRAWEGIFHMNPATWLVSRQITDAAGPWDTRVIDDGEYCSRVILASDGIQFVPDAKVFYRVTGPGSASYVGKSNQKMEAQFLGTRLQIEHLLSRDDSTRTRAACVKLLQTRLRCFYPERPDIVTQAEQLAFSLGGELKAPSLSWKYLWIEKLFGWNLAKRARQAYNRRKTLTLIAWDKVLFQLEKRRNILFNVGTAEAGVETCHSRGASATVTSPKAGSFIQR
jgi:glycosyltransferase involved in cell wall biosynthesis